MIDAKELNRCIDLLAELSAGADQHSKRLILEIGYILKQELDVVNAWDASQRSERERGRHQQIDVKKLLEDNTQLFNENQKLMELNLKMKDVIEKRIPSVETSIKGVNDKFDALETVLNKL
jgi:hypothetical protein